MSGLDENKVNFTKVKSNLMDLQTINRTLDSLVKEIDLLKEDAEKEERKLLKKQQHYDNFYPAYEKAVAQHKKITSDIDAIKNSIQDNEERKKRITTVKEFKALTKELDTLNKKVAIYENELLAKEEEVEYKEQRIKLLEEDIEGIKADLAVKKEELEALIQERQESIEEYEAKQVGVLKKLDNDSIVIFNRIYDNKDSLVIVPIIENVCNGCHMSLPLQVQVEAKKNLDFIYCPSCSRILYADKKAS